MATIIEMPKLSDTMSFGTLVRWLKKEGDAVASGDILAEVQTDKATMEVESFEAGVLIHCYAPEGSQVPIGAPMCAIGKKGEAISAPGSSSPKTPDNNSLQLKKTESQASSQEPSKRLKASPLAKKIAQDHGVALETLQGSGPGGRIVKNDVLAAASVKEPSGVSKPQAPAPQRIASEGRREPLSPMRATIARRLLESKTQIPHFYLDVTVDAQPLMQLRSDLNESYGKLPPEKGGIKFTLNDLILKATAAALTEVPAVNASWGGDHILHPASIHLSFAVALEQGLVTPVIPDAQAKNLREIATQARTLIDKARSGKLLPSEMSNSTFTVTNLGSYGIDGFFGIINPPNAAILAVGGVQNVPVVNSAGAIVPGQRMRLGLSGDHRVIDGAQAAAFLAALKRVMEHPTLMLL